MKKLVQKVSIKLEKKDSKAIYRAKTEVILKPRMKNDKDKEVKAKLPDIAHRKKRARE